MASTYDDNNCVKNGSTKHQWYFSVCQIMPLGEGNAARPASVYCTMGAHFQELQVVKIKCGVSYHSVPHSHIVGLARKTPEFILRLASAKQMSLY